jgi:hypothetical protein
MGISRSRIYEEFNSGALPSFKDGRRRLVLIDDIKAWLARLPPAPTPTRAPSEPPTGPLLPPEQQEAAIARATEPELEPEPDWDAAYRKKRKALAGLGDDESRFRAFDFVVNVCCEHFGCGLEEGKARVRSAISKTAAQ